MAKTTGKDPMQIPMWRYGCVFKTNRGQIVLMRTNENGNVIELRVRIQKSATVQDDNVKDGFDIMTSIIESMDKVVKVFQGISKEKYIITTTADEPSTCVFVVPDVSANSEDQECCLKPCSERNLSAAEIRDLAGLEQMKVAVRTGEVNISSIIFNTSLCHVI